MAEAQERWCLVTGGRGFAARHLVDMLLRYNIYSVRIIDLAPDIKLETHEEKGILGEALCSGRAQYVSVDIRNKYQLFKVCNGVEVVFHMAAPDSLVNNQQLHYSVNVHGTKNIIDACTVLNVKRLIYTSSPSVVFDGIHGISNGVETMPYPAKLNDSYSSTKAEGEALVIKGNGINGLLTCCIRPSNIFGPGDKLLVPTLVAVARARKSKFIIGDGKNMYDFTYVENVAHAHVCAERALASGGTVSKRAAGEAYFITNMEPIRFWDFISLILLGLGYERPKIKIPMFVMMPVAHLVECIYHLLAPYVTTVPPLTPSRIRLLTTNRTFNSLKANDRLGYRPHVPLQDGLKRTIESFSDLRAEVFFRKEGPSKAALYLGNGMVAYILLWRDIKLTVVSKVIIMASIFLFIHGKLPYNLMGYSFEKIPESSFQLTDSMLRQTILSAVSSWNCAAHSIKSISRGCDSMLLLKMVVSLFILTLLWSMSLQNFFVKVLPFSFLVFLLYEKNEEEVDGFLQTFLVKFLTRP